MGQLLSGNPELWGVIGDLFVKNQDWPGAEEMSQRLRKTINPKLLEDDDEDPNSIEAQKAQVQQAAQMIGQKEAELQAAEQQIQQMGQQAQQEVEKAKTAEARVKEMIAKLNEEAQRIEYEKKYIALQQQFFRQAAQAREQAQDAEQQAQIDAVFAKVEQMFAEHELQIKEKVLAGVTDTIGELHNGLANEMKGISDKLNQFEVQGATQ